MAKKKDKKDKKDSKSTETDAVAAIWSAVERTLSASAEGASATRDSEHFSGAAEQEGVEKGACLGSNVPCFGASGLSANGQA